MDILPGEYKTLPPIRLVKRVTIPSGEELSCRISFKKRQITVMGLFLEKRQLQRLLVRSLTRFLDRECRISESRQWCRISRWTGWDIFGNSPQNKNPDGYALPQGKKNPVEDLLTTAEMFFLPPSGQGENCFIYYSQVPGPLYYKLDQFEKTAKSGFLSKGVFKIYVL